MSLRIERLDESFARSHVSELLALLASIPKVEPTHDDLFALDKRGRPVRNRWDLSLVALDGNDVVGVMSSYRREAEPPHYDEPVIYGAALAAHPRATGAGRRLFDEWLRLATEWAQVNEPGIRCALQTNAAPFNERVRRFYERRGFVAGSTKEYENRTDVVMFRSSDTEA